MSPLILVALEIVLSAGPSTPVAVGEHGSPGLDACLSIGKVSVGTAKHALLRVAPSPSAEVSARIENGALVYLCSSSDDGKWHGVVLGPEADEDCGVTSPVEKGSVYSGPCKSGWIEVQAIEVVAG